MELQHKVLHTYIVWSNSFMCNLTNCDRSYPHRLDFNGNRDFIKLSLE